MRNATYLTGNGVKIGKLGISSTQLIEGAYVNLLNQAALGARAF